MLAAVTAFASPSATWPRVPARLPALAECLVLAALLHLLAVALFGSAPGGTARPGEGVWGAINVRLAGTGPARSDAELPPPPDAYSGPPGPAAERRWGGTVRDNQAPQPAEQPGAARLGTWNPARTAEAADPLPPALAQPEAAAPERAVAPAPAPAPLPVPPPAAPPEAAPAAVPAPTLRALPDNSGAPLRELPPLQPTATPLPALQPAPAIAPAPEFVPLLRPPAPVATGTLRPAPAPVATAPTAATLPRLLPAEPVALPAPAPELQAVPLAPSPRGVPTARPAEPSATARTADTLPPRPALGAPDAGATVGHDVATPPTAAASQPRLNLDLVRPRGGEISPLGSRGIVNMLPVPPELKSKLGEDILKSARPDCRTAYAGAGLAGAAPLLADALRKDGCRW